MRKRCRGSSTRTATYHAGVRVLDRLLEEIKSQAEVTEGRIASAREGWKDEGIEASQRFDLLDRDRWSPYWNLIPAQDEEPPGTQTSEALCDCRLRVVLGVDAPTENARADHRVEGSPLQAFVPARDRSDSVALGCAVPSLLRVDVDRPEIPAEEMSRTVRGVPVTADEEHPSDVVPRLERREDDVLQDVSVRADVGNDDASAPFAQG